MALVIVIDNRLCVVSAVFVVLQVFFCLQIGRTFLFKMWFFQDGDADSLPVYFHLAVYEVNCIVDEESYTKNCLVLLAFIWVDGQGSLGDTAFCGELWQGYILGYCHLIRVKFPIVCTPNTVILFCVQGMFRHQLLTDEVVSTTCI